MKSIILNNRFNLFYFVIEDEFLKNLLLRIDAISGGKLKDEDIELEYKRINLLMNLHVLLQIHKTNDNLAEIDHKLGILVEEQLFHTPRINTLSDIMTTGLNYGKNNKAANQSN